MTQFSIQNDIITLPVSFIEQAMPAANGEYVKIYLYALALGLQGKAATTAAIAEKLQLLESDVIRGLEYWAKAGFLSMTDQEIRLLPGSGAVQTPSVRTAASSAPALQDIYRREKIDVETMTADIDANQDLAQMFSVAQEIMGKMISAADSETLYWFYKELGFRPEAILAILEHCVSMNKKSMSYIEKVAIGLHERGIVALEDIDRHFQAERERKAYMGNLKQLFQINDRNLTSMEEHFLSTWHDEWGMSEEMIALAYEYCIMRTNKLSFQYMNGIISSWHSDNIRTVEAAEENSRRRKAPTETVEGAAHGYTGEDLERIAWERSQKG